MGSDKRFTLRWTIDGYKVSKPNIGTMDVVPASDYDTLLTAVRDMREKYKQFYSAAFGQTDEWHDNILAELEAAEARVDQLLEEVV